MFAVKGDPVTEVASLRKLLSLICVGDGVAVADTDEEPLKMFKELEVPSCAYTAIVGDALIGVMKYTLPAPNAAFVVVAKTGCVIMPVVVLVAGTVACT